MRPTALPVALRPSVALLPPSLNQTLPSGPAAIPQGPEGALAPPGSLFEPVANSVISQVLGLTLPIARVVPVSVNQRLPSGPATIPCGWLPALRPAEHSVMLLTSLGALSSILPIAGADSLASANHRLPSEPTAIPCGTLPALPPFPSIENSVAVSGLAESITPIAGVAPLSVNQMYFEPPGPATIAVGLLPALRPLRLVPEANSLISPPGVIRPK